MCRAETEREWNRTLAPCGLRPEVLTPCYGLAENTLHVTLANCNTRNNIMCTRVSEYAKDLVTIVPSQNNAEEGRAEERSEHGQVAGAKEEHVVEVLTCGKPFHCEVVIVDATTCKRLPDGVVGEIWTRGPRKAMGYIAMARLDGIDEERDDEVDDYEDGKEGREKERQEEETRSREHENLFMAQIDGEEVRGGYLRTGDRGAMWEGELYVCGRMKVSQIILPRYPFLIIIRRRILLRYPFLIIIIIIIIIYLGIHS